MPILVSLINCRTAVILCSISPGNKFILSAFVVPQFNIYPEPWTSFDPAYPLRPHSLFIITLSPFFCPLLFTCFSPNICCPWKYFFSSWAILLSRVLYLVRCFNSSCPLRCWWITYAPYRFVSCTKGYVIKNIFLNHWTSTWHRPLIWCDATLYFSELLI